ncbi:hypothetical protein BDQ17DRAFT_1280238, partial [Cyathus striatus]
MSVAFSPDGKQVVSGSSDETVRIWNMEGSQISTGPLEENHMILSSSKLSIQEIHQKYIDFLMSNFFFHNKNLKNIQLTPNHFKILFSLGGPCIYASCHNDGWVRSKNGDVILWVPNHLRAGLCDFDTISIMGQVILCRLDLSKFFHGCDWTNCFTSNINDYVFVDNSMFFMFSFFFKFFSFFSFSYIYILL